MTLLAATVVVAMSSSNASLWAAGAPNAIGLVPSMGRAPWVGTMMSVVALLVTSATAPRCTARRA
ncbi:Uncharacterised protein [Bordetella pertussis]|nr:Uncharacterised protein [Bordetella pertussis]CFW47628.1 Uncharacterised protein [Bordetella pertussis]